MKASDVTVVEVDFSALEAAYSEARKAPKEKPPGCFTVPDLMREKNIKREMARAWVRAGLESGLIEEAGKFQHGNALLYRFRQSHA